MIQNTCYSIIEKHLLHVSFKLFSELLTCQTFDFKNYFSKNNYSIQLSLDQKEKFAFDVNMEILNLRECPQPCRYPKTSLVLSALIKTIKILPIKLTILTKNSYIIFHE